MRISAISGIFTAIFMVYTQAMDIHGIKLSDIEIASAARDSFGIKLVARHAGIECGEISGYTKYKNDEYYFYIDDLRVVKTYRRKRIGEKLLHAMFDAIAKKGISRARLVAIADPDDYQKKLVAWYEKHGGKVVDYYNVGEPNMEFVLPVKAV